MNELPDLGLERWEPTKDTLRLWTQIVGKVRMAVAPPQNHWWHVTLYVDARGLTTRRLPATPNDFEVAFDFIDHRLVVRTTRGDVESFPLVEGLSVARFYERFFGLLTALELDVAIKAEPYETPGAPPFAEDSERSSYDRAAVERFWHALRWIDATFAEFGGWFSGKTSPVHFFWHSFDLALTRFSGRRVPDVSTADRVTREAYSHELISFGFWPGDAKVREPAFYSYTAPEPPGLSERRLRPEAATWQPSGSSHLALLAYDEVRNVPDPHATLLEFLQSAYETGAFTAGWDEDGLRSSWWPGTSFVLGRPPRGQATPVGRPGHPTEAKDPPLHDASSQETRKAVASW
ncbi:MAG: DUF5996 family protein [Actinomycetota bacterium]|nr:DUF5996 family protein [Actinomycetota bacterium]